MCLTNTWYNTSKGYKYNRDSNYNTDKSYHMGTGNSHNMGTGSSHNMGYNMVVTRTCTWIQLTIGAILKNYMWSYPRDITHLGAKSLNLYLFLVNFRKKSARDKNCLEFKEYII